MNTEHKIESRMSPDGNILLKQPLKLTGLQLKPDHRIQCGISLCPEDGEGFFICIILTILHSDKKVSTEYLETTQLVCLDVVGIPDLRVTISVSTLQNSALIRSAQGINDCALLSLMLAEDLEVSLALDQDSDDGDGYKYEYPGTIDFELLSRKFGIDISETVPLTVTRSLKKYTLPTQTS
jgi:hypothetical protein